ncbi:MAG TPA: UDP-N-acetylmuramoyl-tripeptide--D-alanyl-D-alanine ligase, partial [Flavobacterium sp.]|nr:UDP-N-acetylmuramoyl-tripeptide--D-alanyl-D-alanine ligase [Flavobacterium sp.]
MSLKIQHIALQIKASLFGNPDSEIDNISIDSRSLQNNAGTLFFALSGPNHDAHQFIEDLILKGTRNFVAARIPEGMQDKANFLVVENTLEALQDLASFHRKSFHFPVIGITGSNGKTIVKEWLNFLLSPDYNIIRSPKSYNSQVGVPLSILSINEKHNLGIFEAGISTTNEMENLEKIIRPTIGVLTNIGPAHDEGFQGTEEKITEKLKLFKSSEVFICQKDKLAGSAVSKISSLGGKAFTWSFEDQAADVFFTKKAAAGETLLHIKTKTLSFDALIPFQDKASVENAATCLMVLLHLGSNPEIIKKRIRLLYAVEMRLKVKNGINNTAIIDDSYSSDYQSLKIALDFLEQQKQHKKKTLILSDIYQSGLPADELYKKVSELIKSNRIDRTIAIGGEIGKHAAYFQNGTAYKNTQDFIADLKNVHFENETVLIKGARTFKFEEIAFLLEEKTHETVLEINLNAISHNLNFYRSKLKPEIRLMVMVKAFGYGSGGFEIAKLLEYH